VFERLNTGGIKLSQQEIRNSIYHGKFNSLLLDLVKLPHFRAGWGLPPYTKEEEVNPPDELLRIPMYAQMRDVEIVLRFFALRHVAHYQRGMSGFLDLYFVRARAFNDDDLKVLGDLFVSSLEVAHSIYGELLFRPWEVDDDTWSKRPQVAFADAVMVGVSHHLDQADNLIKRRDLVLERTKQLFIENPAGTFTGQRNTKKDVQDRIRLYDDMLEKVVQE
jgi:hypothetical protein